MPTTASPQRTASLSTTDHPSEPRASQHQNMHLANCLSSIPLTRPGSSSSLASQPGSPRKPSSPSCRGGLFTGRPQGQARVNRTLKLCIARPPPKAWRWVKLCSLLFWLSTAAAAMVLVRC